MPLVAVLSSRTIRIGRRSNSTDLCRIRIQTEVVRDVVLTNDVERNLRSTDIVSRDSEDTVLRTTRDIIQSNHSVSTSFEGVPGIGGTVGGISLLVPNNTKAVNAVELVHPLCVSEQLRRSDGCKGTIPRSGRFTLDLTSVVRGNRRRNHNVALGLLNRHSTLERIHTLRGGVLHQQGVSTIRDTRKGGREGRIERTSGNRTELVFRSKVVIIANQSEGKDSVKIVVFGIELVSRSRSGDSTVIRSLTVLVRSSLSLSNDIVAAHRDGNGVSNITTRQSVIDLDIVERVSQVVHRVANRDPVVNLELSARIITVNAFETFSRRSAGEVERVIEDRISVIDMIELSGDRIHHDSTVTGFLEGGFAHGVRRSMHHKCRHLMLIDLNFTFHSAEELGSDGEVIDTAVQTRERSRAGSELRRDINLILIANEINLEGFNLVVESVVSICNRRTFDVSTHSDRDRTVVSEDLRITRGVLLGGGISRRIVEVIFNDNVGIMPTIIVLIESIHIVVTSSKSAEVGNDNILIGVGHRVGVGGGRSHGDSTIHETILILTVVVRGGRRSEHRVVTAVSHSHSLGVSTTRLNMNTIHFIVTLSKSIQSSSSAYVNHFASSSKVSYSIIPTSGGESNLTIEDFVTAKGVGRSRNGEFHRGFRLIDVDPSFSLTTVHGAGLHDSVITNRQTSVRRGNQNTISIVHFISVTGLSNDGDVTIVVGAVGRIMRSNLVIERDSRLSRTDGHIKGAHTTIRRRNGKEIVTFLQIVEDEGVLLNLGIPTGNLGDALHIEVVLGQLIVSADRSVEHDQLAIPRSNAVGVRISNGVDINNRPIDGHIHACGSFAMDSVNSLHRVGVGGADSASGNSLGIGNNLAISGPSAVSFRPSVGNRSNTIFGSSRESEISGFAIFSRYDSSAHMELVFRNAGKELVHDRILSRLTRSRHINRDRSIFGHLSASFRILTETLIELTEGIAVVNDVGVVQIVDEVGDIHLTIFFNRNRFVDNIA